MNVGIYMKSIKKVLKGIIWTYLYQEKVGRLEGDIHNIYSFFAS